MSLIPAHRYGLQWIWPCSTQSIQSPARRLIAATSSSMRRIKSRKRSSCRNGSKSVLQGFALSPLAQKEHHEAPDALSDLRLQLEASAERGFCLRRIPERIVHGTED